jgi:hypothetical protein
LCGLRRAPCGRRLYCMPCSVLGASSTCTVCPAPCLDEIWQRSCASEFKFEGTNWLRHKRFWLVFSEVPALNLGRHTDYSNVLREFPQSRHVNSWRALFLFAIVVGGVQLGQSTLRPLIGLLCQSRVIMMMEKLVEW